jgi:mycothiol synthase
LPSPRDAEEYLRQPNLHPEQDSFIAELSGQPAGYALVVPELKIGRAIIEGLVAPRWRRRGIGHALLERGLRHAAGLGAKVAHVSTSPENTAAIAILNKVGFAETRRQWLMRLAPADRKGQRSGPSAEGRGAGARVRHLRPEEVALMTDLQNRAFTGSWGFAPNVPQEVAYRLGMGGGRPEDTLILELESVPLAYCWTQMQTLDGQPTGIIWMIGAVPEARGKGLGREMLLASLDYLLGRGAKAIELTVYQDNTPAVELYKATGFKPTGEIVFYEKKL